MPDNPVADDRLDSWKEIAAYLRRDITTVQRWEKREGMPVRRHLHDKLGSVFAFRSELDAWARSRNLGGATEPEDSGAEAHATGVVAPSPQRVASRARVWTTATAILVLFIALMGLWARRNTEYTSA